MASRLRSFVITFFKENNVLEVTEQAFWDKIKALDVHPTPIGRFPYTSVFRHRNGIEVGRSVPTNRCDGVYQHMYFLA